MGQAEPHEVPYRLPMFPLGTVLFPRAQLPLHVFEPRYRQLTADCLAGDGELGVVLITRGREVGGGDQRAAVGTVGHIDRSLGLPDGRWLLSVGGRRRLRVVEWLAERPYPVAMVEDLDPREGSAAGGGEGSAPSSLEEALGAVRRARALLSELGRGRPLPVELESDVRAAATIEMAAWLLCDAAPLGDLDRQRLLEADPGAERLERLRSMSGEVADDLERMLAG